MYRSLIVLMLAGFLAACGQTPTTSQPALPSATPQRASAWGDIHEIARAEQRDTATLFSHDDGLFFVWGGADEEEARIYARGVNHVTAILALRAYYPFGFSLFDGGRNILMLWQDRAINEVGQTHLYAGLVSPHAVAEFGPNTISRLPTRKYSATQANHGTVYVVFSSNEGVRPDLYINTVDIQARAQQPIVIRKNADDPALIFDSDENLHLFWLEEGSTGRDVYHAFVDIDAAPPLLVSISKIGVLPTRPQDTGRFSVASDGDYAYLFWNIQHQDMSRSVYFASGEMSKAAYTAPELLGVTFHRESAVQVPFNKGYALTAEHSTDLLSWAVPAQGQLGILPVVTLLEEQLGVAYFQEGDLYAYQAVVDHVSLVGAPALWAKNNDLFLLWAESDLGKPAVLNMVSTDSLRE